MAVETFKPVPGWERTYEISNNGRIRRTASWGKNRKCGHFLKPETTRDGYRRVVLCDHPRRRHKLVHVLVALTFIGPCLPCMEVNHKDGNKNNNRLDNLEYATKKENAEHKVQHHLHAYGEKHGQSKLRTRHVRNIIRIYSMPNPPAFVVTGMRYNITGSQVSAIVHGRAWKHLQPSTGMLF